MIISCCICKKWYNNILNEWLTPTSEDIEKYTGLNRISHGYCPPCFVSNMEKEGFTTEEINKGLEELTK